MLKASLRALDRTPAGPPLRALRRAVKPELRRDDKDNRALGLLLAFCLAPDSNCVDVGSYRGSVLGEMLRIAPHGSHIAYEPLPELAAGLAREFPGVDVRPVALSNEGGAATFVHVRSRPGYSGLKERPYPGKERTETIEVRVETLDSSLPEGYVPSLVKIDVEGAEARVIEGGLETISRHRPIVVFEHGTAARAYGTGPDEIHRLLCGEGGLRIFDLDGNGPYGVDTFARTVERGTHWNFVAHV